MKVRFLLVLLGLGAFLSFIILLHSKRKREAPQETPHLAFASLFKDAERQKELKRVFVKEHQNPNVLFFNRVPKTGSEMVVLLLQWLQRNNRFKHVRLKNSVKRYLTKEQQFSLAAEIGDILSDTQENLVSFDRHIHFTNFSNLGLKMPLLVNIIRDPVEKLISRFYYARVTPRPGAPTPPNYTPPKLPPFSSLEECIEHRGEECTFINGQEYDLTIPYFCGHEQFCRKLNDQAALSRAKSNADEWYAAIGVLENLNETLKVFEDALPAFFGGVTRLYHEELMGLHHNMNRQKPRVSIWVEERLGNNLSMEFEFYDFINQKLYSKYYETLNKS